MGQVPEEQRWKLLAFFARSPRLWELVDETVVTDGGPCENTGGSTDT